MSDWRLINPRTGEAMNIDSVRVIGTFRATGRWRVRWPWYARLWAWLKRWYWRLVVW